MDKIVRKLAQRFSGPVVFCYVWWVLWESKQRGLDRLYFLARDGYTLHRIAELICERFNLGIECRYLYCSRTSLRMPTYFFIGDEALDLLLLGGYRLTLKSVLLRGELTDEERQAIYEECGIRDEDEEKLLSRREFEEYSKEIRESRTFQKLIVDKSRSAYKNAVGYFKAEGLMDQPEVGIVDSGWAGSMQRSLRQLLEFAGYSGHFVGFYFGMYTSPKSRADGEYLTWYFDAESNAKEKAQFCNNLFECLLSAPHGMTVSYEVTDGEYKPVLLPSPEGKELALILEQSESICEYARMTLEQIDFYGFNREKLQKETYKLIKRYMFHPTQDEAAYYGQFLFCDDVTESYRIALAGEIQKKLLKNYFIPARLCRRVIKHHLAVEGQAELFWPYGTIAFLPPWEKWWYQANVYVWELIRYGIESARIKTGTDIDEIRREIDRHKVVSFDIFDTLVYRTVNKPVDVFRLMEPWVEKEFGIKNFAESRREAEKRARSLTDEEEISFPEIYKAMEIQDDVAAQLMECECRTELFVLRRDETMSELFSYCVERGKRVLIISDMYHDEAFLKTALHHVGIGGYDRLYVSSAEKVTKASGMLFRKVGEKEGIKDMSLWLHIGDNLYSDYAMPRAVGMVAKLYDNGRSVTAADGFGFRHILRMAKSGMKCRLIHSERGRKLKDVR